MTDLHSTLVKIKPADKETVVDAEFNLHSTLVKIKRKQDSGDHGRDRIYIPLW